MDLDAFGRGLRAHRALQNQLANAVAAAGLKPLSPTLTDPNFDLAWQAAGALFLVEVKSLTRANEAHQLRYGIGQLLDYAASVRERTELPMQLFLYVEHEPADPRWTAITEAQGIRLAWPAIMNTVVEGTEDRRKS